MNAQPIRLAPESVDAVARRVAEILTLPTADTSPVLIDAAEVARRFGVTRSYVYEHAGRLGAVRLGSGDRPRLRFDPETVAAVLDNHSAIAERPASSSTSSSRRRPNRSRTSTGARLLPIGETGKTA